MSAMPVTRFSWFMNTVPNILLSKTGPLFRKRAAQSQGMAGMVGGSFRRRLNRLSSHSELYVKLCGATQDGIPHEACRYS